MSEGDSAQVVRERVSGGDSAQVVRVHEWRFTHPLSPLLFSHCHLHSPSLSPSLLPIIKGKLIAKFHICAAIRKETSVACGVEDCMHSRAHLHSRT